MTQDALWHLSAGHTDLTEISPYVTLEKKGAATEIVLRPVAAAAPAAAPGARLRVMVADDDEVIRMLLKKFIEGAGFAVVEAVDGEEALTAIAGENPPDMLLSDINMPKMNGYDLVKGVRETLGLSDLPIIMLTTEGSDKSQEMAFKLGADDYIIKPFKAPLVIARINAALRRAGKLK
jgi:DNA-binding response OmpR family regulator